MNLVSLYLLHIRLKFLLFSCSAHHWLYKKHLVRFLFIFQESKCVWPSYVFFAWQLWSWLSTWTRIHYRNSTKGSSTIFAKVCWLYCIKLLNHNQTKKCNKLQKFAFKVRNTESARVAGNFGSTTPRNPSVKFLSTPIVVAMATFSIPRKVAWNFVANTTGRRCERQVFDVQLIIEEKIGINWIYTLEYNK